MTNDQFDALVQRVEARFGSDPQAYRRRVVALAMLGYAYIALVIGLALAGLYLIFWLLTSFGAFSFALGFSIPYLIIPIAGFVVLILRAMWVRAEATKGRALTRDEAPALFDVINELCNKLEAPRFDDVQITTDFNAAIAQIPRLGVLGWHRHALYIGLPYLKAHGIEQLRCVLAHELAHLSEGHGRTTYWIYRMRMRWSRLMEALDTQRSKAAFVFRMFFDWYAPYFNAFSFPLARATEFQADRVSAELTSPRAAAEALTAAQVVGSYLEERYWPALFKRADDTERPGVSPYAEMSERLSGDLDEPSACTWIKKALAQKTDPQDTHPSFADRLRALGEAPRLALPGARVSADALLGDALTTITSEFDAQWREGVTNAWQSRYREAQQARAKIAELETQIAAGGELETAAALEFARLTEEFGAGAEVALEQFRALHARDPQSAIHAFELGVRLLARDDEAGYALVTGAIEKDAGLAIAGYEALGAYCQRNGRDDEFRSWRERWNKRMALIEKARREREWTTVEDAFEPHGLSDEAIDSLRRQLAEYPQIRIAYLVRRKLRYLAEHPFYVLAVKLGAEHRLEDHGLSGEMVRDAIADKVTLPGETIVISLEGAHGDFGVKLRFVEASKIVGD